ALYGQPRGRRPLEVVRLHDRRAAEEGERRFGHAGESDGQELFYTVLVRLLEQGQRVALPLSKDRRGVAGARARLPQRLSLEFAGRAFRRRRVLPRRDDGGRGDGLFAVLIGLFHRRDSL